MTQPECRDNGCSPNIGNEESHLELTLSVSFALVICPRGQLLATGVHTVKVLGMHEDKNKDIVAQKAILLPLQKVG